MPAGLLTRHGPNRLSSLFIGLCLAAGCTAQLFAGSDAATGTADPPMRFAVSDKVVCGVSLNDARAAIAVWSSELLKIISFKARFASDQDWVKPSADLLGAIRSGTVDVFCITVQEYRQVSPYVDTSRVITDNVGGEELLLVVREESGIKSLAGLRGRSLIIQESPNTSLAEPWLDVSFKRENLGSPGPFLAHVTRSAKLSHVVLPLFFGQADACVVTRRGLDTMCELNPQLSRKLRVLLSSPRAVSAFFAFRKDYPAHLKAPIFDGLINLRSAPTSRQVLTLFQTPGFMVQGAECLGPANTILDSYDRYRNRSAGGRR